MATDKKPSSSKKNNVSISGDVNGVVIVGNENTVNQTIIQKFFNIFKSDAETLEQRNRRILLGHVENAWIKGVLDASLYGAAMLDLGIKETPDAITNQYPWALKKESTDETLPAGTSMLEIFDSIGMGRSLLILGAPGSGKTTMLLELARGLIARAREDVTQPIPMVFNLASWTEKLTLADWLAQELNNLYSVPRKTAPDWVKGNKLFLLLDGLDEVRQESRVKCVGAINEFRKQSGMTSLAVCSRSQDYADLNAKLAFEGAIEVQPLTQGQITEFFNRFGDEMAGIKQALEKDSGLREMAETPLFLSIMLMAYRDKRDVEILVSGDERARHKHLFDAYIERMFERPRAKNTSLKKQEVIHRLTWLADKIVKHSTMPYLIEDMQPQWLDRNKQWSFKFICWLFFSLFIGLVGCWVLGSVSGLVYGPVLGMIYQGIMDEYYQEHTKIDMAGPLQTTYPGQRISFSLMMFLLVGPIISISVGLICKATLQPIVGLSGGQFFGLMFGSVIWMNIGGGSLIQHYTLRFILARNNLLPWRLVPFLDHCVDLIFLRRVGGGYIFIHRLLMEHFAEMYVESPTSKGN